MEPKPVKFAVHKFGGTSVGTGPRMLGCADRVRESAADGEGIIVVSSAMHGVTDTLLTLIDRAARGEHDPADLDGLRHHHANATPEVRIDAAEVVEIVDAIAARLDAAATLRDGSARTRDGIVACGEKLAVRLLAGALRARGFHAVAVDADEFLETDDAFGSAAPIHDVAEARIRRTLQPLVLDGKVPVVTGFCGRAPDGSTTTLGRGGSDWSATLIAGAIDAERVVIWTDVDGVYSADPRVVPEARSIPHLNYREAGELSHYGAKVLHQRTILPVAGKSIPIHIRSTMAPHRPGTIIDGRLQRGSHPVKGISAIPDQAIVSVEGRGMAGVPGVASSVFGALAAAGVNVTMISQSGSESSICLAIADTDAGKAELALKREFRDALSHGDIEEIVVQRDAAIVAAVGLGMAHTPGVAARICGALAARDVNIIAIAQGSSELNVSLAIAQSDVESAIRAIHESFGLDRLDTGEDTTRRLDLVLIGLGGIGRGFVELIANRKDAIRDRVGLDAHIVGVCDRSGHILDPRGIPEAVLERAFEAKTSGRSIAQVEGAVSHDGPADLIEAAGAYRLARPILIDVTDADFDEDLFITAFDRGMDVVTANKRPLAGPAKRFRALIDGAAHARRHFLAEATVGAGLPVLDTLDTLIATGDVPRRIEGCLSGTLAFVLGEMEKGRKLSQAVRDAVDQGYTEPDPGADLGGLDVARKALILGRLAGLLEGDTTPDCAPFVADLPTGKDAVLGALQDHDDDFSKRFDAAKANGCVLRYVARIESGRADVGLREVPADSSLGRLSGTDNMLVFTSDRYATRPLVITGPGAGIDVTAMAVLADVLRIAAERAGNVTGAPTA